MKIDLDGVHDLRKQISIVHNGIQNILLDTKFSKDSYQLHNVLTTTHRKILTIDHFLQDAIQSYENAEHSLTSKANQLTSKKWNTDTFHFEHDFQFKNNSNFTLDDKFMLGIGAVGSASLSLFRTSKHYRYGDIKTSLQMDVGTTGVNGKGTFVLFKDGKVDPSLNMTLNARASIAHLEARTGYQNDVFGVQGSASVDVGTAHAQAKAVISKEETTLKIDYGVAAISGKVQGKVSLFGFHLDATLEGEAMAFSGGAEFSKGSDYVEIGGKFSLFAGLGFKIRISRD